MADSVYKGLTIEFRAKTTGVQTALGQLTREARKASRELSGVDRALKTSPGNVELLRQKEAAAAKQAQVLRERVASVTAALQQTDRGTAAYDRLQRDLVTTKARLVDVEAEAARASAALRAMEEFGPNVARALETRWAMWDSRAKSLGSAAESMEASSRALSSVGGTLTRTLTPAVLGVGYAAVKSAIDYESAFAGVQKTVDMTDAEFAKLYEDTLALSETAPISATDIMYIEELGGQLGIANDNLLSFAETIAGVTASTNLDLEDAATEFAQFANITGMSQSDFDKLASTLVGLGNNAATTERDIMAMAMRIAGAGTSAGMSVQDIMAMSTTLSSLGINAEAGGTAISTIISNIDKAVALNTNAAQVWADTWASATGRSADEFAAAWGDDPVVALEAVIEGMASMQDEGGNLSVLLEELGVTSIRQTDAFKRMANGGDLFNRMLSLSRKEWDRNAALQDEVSRRYGTTESQLQILKNRLENAAATLGGPLASALTGAMDAAEPLIQGIADGARAFADMDEGSRRTILTLAGLAAALGPGIKVLGKFSQLGAAVVRGMESFATSRASTYKTAFTTLTDTMSGVETSATRASRAVQSVGSTSGGSISMAPVVAEMDTVERKASTTSEKVRGVATGMAEANGVVLGGAREELGKTASKAESTTTSAKKVKGGIQTANQANVATAVGTIGSMGEASKTATSEAGKVKGGIETANKANVDKAVKKLSGPAGISGAASGAASVIRGTLYGALTGLGVGAAIAGVTALVDYFVQLKENAESWETATSGVKGVLEEFDPGSADTIGEAAESASSKVQSAMDDLDERVRSSEDFLGGFSERLAQMNFDNGSLDSLVGRIETLNSKTGQTTADKEAFLTALSEFEAATGQTVDVLTNENGDLQVNMDHVLALAEAWKTLNQAKGYQAALDQANGELVASNINLEKHVQDRAEILAQLSEAREKLRDAGFDPDNPVDAVGFMDGTGEVSAAALQVIELQEALDAMDGVIEKDRELVAANEESVAFLQEQIDAYVEQAASAQLLAQNLNALQGEAGWLDETLSEGGQTVDSFAEALSQAGVTTDELGGLYQRNGDAVRQLAEGFDGSAESIMRSLDEMGESALYASQRVDEMTEGEKESLTEATEAWLRSNDAFAKTGSSMGAVDGYFDKLANAMTSLGITTSDLDRLSGDSLAHIAENFDGTWQSLATTLVEMGLDGEGYGTEFIDNIRKGIEDGTILLTDDMKELAEALGLYRPEIGIATEQVDVPTVEMPEIQDRTSDYVAAAQADGTAYNEALDETVGSHEMPTAASAEIDTAASESGAQDGETYAEAFDEKVAEMPLPSADSVMQGQTQGFVDAGKGNGEAAASATADGFSSGSDEIRGSVQAVAAHTKEDLGSAMGGMEEVGFSAASDLSAGVASGSGEVSDSSSLLGESAFGALVSLPDEMEARGKVSGWSLGFGVSSQSGTVESAGSKVASAGVSGMDGKWGSAFSVGYNLTLGLAAGIGSSGAIAAVTSAATSAVTSAVNAAKSAGQIHSPSRVMEQVGIYWGEGLAQGIEESARKVSDSAYRVMQASLPGKAGGAASGGGSSSSVTNVYVNGTYNDDVAVSRITGEYIRQMAEMGAM